MPQSVLHEVAPMLADEKRTCQQKANEPLKMYLNKPGEIVFTGGNIRKFADDIINAYLNEKKPVHRGNDEQA